MDRFIYNQRTHNTGQLRYGLLSSAATGCGWIAVYNALLLLGKFASPESLIRYFRVHNLALGGTLGTDVFAPAVFFQKKGYKVKIYKDLRKFDAAAAAAKASLLWYHWRQGYKMGAHFVALHKKDGEFIGYNTYKNSVGPDRYGPSLREYILRQKWRLAELITIEE